MRFRAPAVKSSSIGGLTGSERLRRDELRAALALFDPLLAATDAGDAVIAGRLVARNGGDDIRLTGLDKWRA